MLRVNLKISGRVQGVGFRYFTEVAGLNIGVTGWVRNLVDGRVEAEAQGQAEEIELFLCELGKGPILARVKKIDKLEMPLIDDENKFSVRY